MQTELQNHYKQIRTSINSNIATIRTLIDQADSLQKIVESISDSDQQENKAKLQKEISNINSSISTLIENTESLFKVYDEFIQALNSSK